MNNKTIGIIAEYNPFHNGHKYQLAYAKKILQAKFCVVAMSGNFVQRGAPAIVDKYVRAQTAILEGADLVLEIPACFATGSLDDFSLGAVSALDALGVITHLVFGTETGDLCALSRISEAMLSKKDSFQILRQAMKSGLTYDMAQLTSLCDIEDQALLTSCMKAVNKPNCILGILYLNALRRLNSDIVPVTHPRIGQAYLDDSRANMLRSGRYASATAIRRCLLLDDTVMKENLSEYIPINSYNLLMETLKKQSPMSEKHCWKALCKVLSEMTEDLASYYLVSPTIAEGIEENWKRCNSWDELVACVASADTSPLRVNRCLIHLLLGIKQSQMYDFLQYEICCYTNVLAVSKRGHSLLERIRKVSRIPVLPTEGEDILSPRFQSQYIIDRTADALYTQLIAE